LHQIGVGVLGPVYRAQDTVRDQLVAVKVFKVDAPPEQAEQIAEALQAVVQALPRHRGLVEFIAAGVERDTAYLVMAHSDVPSLDSRLKPGAADSSTPPVDAEQALVIVRTLAEAMDAAHARGIVHGGLHPRDIFVDDRGVCRAAGFGVATALARAGVRVPVRRPYSPPERLTSAPIEPPADRFTLGAIAFELLTGRRIAGTGSSAAARYNASVPGADLDAVRNALAAMLAEQPAHRPSTANAFAQALSLALFPQGVARASAAGANGADRSPAAAARDDRHRRDGNTVARPGATGAGAGEVAAGGALGGAIAVGASNLSRDSDGPSPDDLELFTREGLFTGQPRQNTLRWEPVEVENVVPPGEDPLELFAPSPNTESPAESEAAASEAVAATVADGNAQIDRKADAETDSKTEPKTDAPEALPEVVVARPDSILGLSTTIVALREPDVPTPAARDARDERQGDDDGNETTALPFVPIKADPRLSPVSPRLDDSVLIDDNSRLDALERVEHPDGLETLETLDRLDRDDHDGHAGVDDDADDAADADQASPLTPAAAAAAGVVAAGGVTSGVDDFAASHLGHHTHHAEDTSPFDRDAREAETWVAPAAASVTHSSSSMLMDPPDTSDVGSSVRVVALVLALGLAVGGAGGYLLGQRSALRNASAFDQATGNGETGSGAAPARPAAAAGDPAGSASAGNAGKPPALGTDVALPAANSPSARPGSAPAGGASAAGSAAGSTAAARPAGASPAAGASAPAAATGRLTISSTPARADVAIDGVRRGVTPLTLRDLPFGSHTVRVTRGGYAPETRRVNIVAGRPAEPISIDLEPTAPRTRPSSPGAGPAASAAAPAPERGSASGLGALYVVSRPMGARVTVDGRLVGATPLLLTDVSSGSHTIQLQADGHKPWQTTVQVKMGERTRVAASLEEGR
jgi:hypothetical protein